MEKRDIDYECDGIRLCGVAVLPSRSPGDASSSLSPRPGVLVAPDFRGRSSLQITNAERIAALGYVALAIDMYGEGKSGSTLAESGALMNALREDRALLMRRVNAALDTLHALPEVDGKRTGAIGFCFGGMCVLDLARSGADVRGVVSFHGLFAPPPSELCKPIRATVLALHGYDDPMVPPEHVVALGNELRASGVDWQIHAYGNTVHGFTNPAANNPTTSHFNQVANDRAFRSMQDFFADLFG